MGIQHKLSRFPVSDAIWYEYHLDQEINDRGIGVDMAFVANALTGLYLDYLQDRSDFTLEEIGKNIVNLVKQFRLSEVFDKKTNN